jgi:heterodisulfide reductase subunit A2
VGSLDERHQPYCSGVCCSYALKFNHLVRNKLPESRIYHLYKELVIPGKEEFSLYRHASHNPKTEFLRYRDIAELQVTAAHGRPAIQYRDAHGSAAEFTADMVVLCPAIIGSESAGGLSKILDVPMDQFGFFQELHGRLDAEQSKVRGIYLAGACQSPMDIRGAIGQGMAVAGYVLSGLADGKKLKIEPITASVDPSACSGCRICGNVCPYQAISYSLEPEAASVNALLCHGCGTCVAACPAGAIQSHHFDNQQIFAEMEAALQ